MQSKTTRAFRTISEAGEELDLQPHVLRFWESKFPQIKPIKRGGGRRFYRPEDIEFLRGIKILLHDEKHPIKDVQKLIRVKGPGRIMELGRSVEPAAIPKKVKDTTLIPDRIRRQSSDTNDGEDINTETSGLSAFDEPISTGEPKIDTSPDNKIVETGHVQQQDERPVPTPSFSGRGFVSPSIAQGPRVSSSDHVDTNEDDAVEIELPTAAQIPAYTDRAQDELAHDEAYVDVEALESALSRLETLKARWDSFRK